MTSIVDRHFLLLKAHYFLFFGAFGALYPILNITLRSRGLSTNEVSYMNMIIPFLIFFTNPLLGFIADCSRRPILTMNSLILLVTILYAILFFLPPIKSDEIQGIIEEESNPTLKFCLSHNCHGTYSKGSNCGSICRANCSLKVDEHRIFTLPSNITDYVEKNDRLTSKDACSVHYRIPIGSSFETNNRFP